MISRRVALGLMVCACSLLASQLPAFAAGDDVQEVVENGIRYRVTTQTRQRLIPETTTVEQPQTVYREKITNEPKQATRAYQVPVTQWVAEPYVANPWAVFAPPQYAYRYVPVTHWETKTENYQVQVPNREYEKVQQTVKVPVTNQRLVEEKFVSKVALGPASATDPNAANRAIVGGSGAGSLDPATAVMARRERTDSDLGGRGTTNDFKASPR